MQWYWTPHTDNATLLLREQVPLNSTIVPCWPNSTGAESTVGSESGGRALRSPFGAHPVHGGIQAEPMRGAAPSSAPAPSGPAVTCVDWSFRALAHPADDPIRYTEEEYFVEAGKAQGLIEAFH